MATAKRNEPVTETKVVVVKEGSVDLTLTDEEAKQLLALLGDSADPYYNKENQVINGVYTTLSNALPEYRSWSEYHIRSLDGKPVEPYVIKARENK